MQSIPCTSDLVKPRRLQASHSIMFSRSYRQTWYSSAFAEFTSAACCAFRFQTACLPACRSRTPASTILPQARLAPPPEHTCTACPSRGTSLAGLSTAATQVSGVTRSNSARWQREDLLELALHLPRQSGATSRGIVATTVTLAVFLSVLRPVPTIGENKLPYKCEITILCCPACGAHLLDSCSPRQREREREADRHTHRAHR